MCCGAGRQPQDRSDCFLPLPVAHCGNRPVFRLGWHLAFVHHFIVYWAVSWALLDHSNNKSARLVPESTDGQALL